LFATSIADFSAFVYPLFIFFLLIQIPYFSAGIRLHFAENNGMIRDKEFEKGGFSDDQA